jgi:hypothetical protein
MAVVWHQDKTDSLLFSIRVEPVVLMVGYKISLPLPLLRVPEMVRGAAPETVQEPVQLEVQIAMMGRDQAGGQIPEGELMEDLLHLTVLPILRETISPNNHQRCSLISFL